MIEKKAVCKNSYMPLKKTKNLTAIKTKINYES